VACIRKRRGKYVVDYRDALGRRRWVTCDTRRESERVLSERLSAVRRSAQPAIDPEVRVAAYAERWLALVAAGLKPRTLESYAGALRIHLLPLIGTQKLRELQRGQVKTLLAEKLTSGLSRATVRILHATLRTMLNAAIDDGVLAANPADKLGRYLRLVPVMAARQDGIKAFTREQLAAFLGATMDPEASHHDRRHLPFFLCLARAGLRLGEAFALQWQDLDFAAGKIRVVRAFSDGRLDTPKSGHGRTVDMSKELAQALRRHQLAAKTEGLKKGWRETPPWVFCSEEGTPLDKHNLYRVFRRLLARAELPSHFTPHCLRHTFASLLLQQGESPVYVQRQLGHASIKLTVDTYGKWLPIAPTRGGVDALDDRSGSKVVAESRSVRRGRPQLMEKISEPSRDRTEDPLIKSQVLCLLS
jgi:integrase